MQRVKKCPICGAQSRYNKEDLGRENGRGYPGKFTIKYECTNCRMVIGRSADTIYNSNEDAEKMAIENWNNKVNEVQKYLDSKFTKSKRYLLKEKIILPVDKDLTQLYKLINDSNENYELIIDNNYIIRQYTNSYNLFYVHTINNQVIKICWYIKMVIDV